MKQKNKKTKSALIPQKWLPIPIASVVFVIGICFIALSGMAQYLALSLGISAAASALTLGTLSIVGKRGNLAFAIKLTSAAALLTLGIIAAVLGEDAAGTVGAVFAAAVAVSAAAKLTAALFGKKDYSKASQTLLSAICAPTLALSLVMLRITPTDGNSGLMRVSLILIGAALILDAAAIFALPFLKTKKEALDKKIKEDYEAYGLKTPKELEDELKSYEKEEEKEDEKQTPKEPVKTAEVESEPVEALEDEPFVKKQKAPPQKKKGANSAPRAVDDSAATREEEMPIQIETLSAPKIIEQKAPVKDEKYDVVITAADVCSFGVLNAVCDFTHLAPEEVKSKLATLPTVIMESVTPEVGRAFVLRLMELDAEAELKAAQSN